MVDCFSMPIRPSVNGWQGWGWGLWRSAVPGSSFFREPVHRYVRLHFTKKAPTPEEPERRLMNLHTPAQIRH